MKLSKIFAVVLLCFFIAIGHSQNSNEPATITNTFVIENVHILSAPGKSSVFGSILMKDGLIQAVGTNVTIPFDAEIIDGDSMYVYPGFIDALSNTGIPKSEEDKKEKIKNPGNPPNNRAGITPQHSAFDFIDPSEKSIKNLRDAGVTIAHVVPQGKMLPGQGAVISLKGNTAEEMTLKKDVSMYTQFKSASRMYPGTIIGVMAKWRELFRRAEYAKKHNTLFSSNPVGIQRPSYEKELEAFFPVIDKKQKVYFKAEKALTINRALTLQKELGFPIVLTDVKQADQVIKKIKASGAQLLVSLDLPKAEKEDGDKKEEEEKADSKKKKENKKEDGISASVDVTKKKVDVTKKKVDETKKMADETQDKVAAKKKTKKKKKAKKKDPEVEALTLRKKESAKKYVAQAAVLEKNNIPFSFSFLSGKAKELHNTIRRMVKEGLSEKAALEALTTNPAKLLGISNVAGSIDKGKMANLIMTDKPYFEEKSKIKYVFVDGHPFKTEEKKKKKKTSESDDTADVVGKWDYEMDIPMPNNTGIILIEKVDDAYKVSVANAEDLTDFEVIEDVVVEDGTMEFSFDVDNGGFMMNIGMELNFEGDDFEGSITAGDFGTFDMTGKRTSKTPN